jgi:RNA polymerase sigma-B factor
MQELVLEVTAATDCLTNLRGVVPTTADLAAHLGRTVDEVEEALLVRANHRPASLDDQRSGRACAEPSRLDGDLDRVIDRTVIADAVRRLPSREQEMLMLRFGEGMAQHQIAAEFGISQVHVSRLLSGALSRLRNEGVLDPTG